MEPPNIGPPAGLAVLKFKEFYSLSLIGSKIGSATGTPFFTSMGRYRDPPLPIQTTMQSKYSGTSTLGHLFSRETSIHGTQNLVLEKCSHINLCTCYP